MPDLCYVEVSVVVAGGKVIASDRRSRRETLWALICSLAIQLVFFQASQHVVLTTPGGRTVLTSLMSQWEDRPTP